MTEMGEQALLPAGLQDLLIPDAAREAAVVERLIASFGAFGYQRVKPPLVEFEETLLSGPGLAVAQRTFRLMDPVSQRMMALRADITPQVARIAATRLAKAPRPLRLCYSGQVLRVKGTQLRPERQVGQVGVELFGAEEGAADAEVVLLAAEALTAAGVRDLSVDLTQPTLVAATCAGLGLDDTLTPRLRAALDRKDAAAVARLSGAHDELFQALLRAAGPADAALADLLRIALPAPARAALDSLAEVLTLVRRAAPDLTVTIDPVEHRGFEYQTGVSFTLFAGGVRGELGRGGRYRSKRAQGPDEAATGFTLYGDTVLRAVAARETRARIYLPFGTAPAEAVRLRGEGWATVAGLRPEADSKAEARRLGCARLWREGQAAKVED